MMDPVIQGWCPGALRPMMSGDGLVVRLRARGGRLDGPQARAIAGLATTFGSGVLDLSARANLQIRGVTEASHAPLIEGLLALGLIDDSAEIEARRNIVIAPFWQEGDAAQTIAAELAKGLACAAAPALPGKFGFAIDLGAAPLLRDTSADIRIERGANGLLLCAGAGPGKPVTRDQAAGEAIALAHWFIAQGGVINGRGRMAALLKTHALPEGFTEPRLAPGPQPKPGTTAPGITAQGQLIGFDFGQIRAETLSALADLGALRLTPWRMVLVEGLHHAPDLPGIITRADDPMLRVIACTGAPGCLQARGDTRSLARALAPHLTAPLHVSGCAKGCAHPGAMRTLTATDDGFDLICDGPASGVPARSGLSAGALIADPTLLEKARP